MSEAAPDGRQLLAMARGYHCRGWQVVPIPPREKGPTLDGWGKLRLTLTDLPGAFRDAGNIGVILGPPSGELVDMDLDCPEALALADIYLPKTGAEFGRSSKWRAHRLFVASGAAKEAFADPVSGGMLLELRAAGRNGGAHQTLFPPSVHPSGERIEWHGATTAPAVIDARVLRRRAVLLAIACLIARYISESAAQRPGPDLPRVLWEFDREIGRAAYRWLGLPDPDAPQRYPRRRQELSRRELDLTEVVAAIPNNFDWEGWNRTGMAIWVASGGSEDGFIVFDDFSAKSPKYEARNTEARWRHYHRSPPSRIGPGTLVHLARAAGWRPNKERHND